MEDKGYDKHYIDVGRKIYKYDGKEIVDVIDVERRGSLDQFLYVEIYE
jgi:hypothetical protein